MKYNPTCIGRRAPIRWPAAECIWRRLEASCGLYLEDPAELRAEVKRMQQANFEDRQGLLHRSDVRADVFHIHRCGQRLDKQRTNNRTSEIKPAACQSRPPNDDC